MKEYAIEGGRKADEYFRVKTTRSARSTNAASCVCV